MYIINVYSFRMHPCILCMLWWIFHYDSVLYWLHLICAGFFMCVSITWVIHIKSRQYAIPKPIKPIHKIPNWHIKNRKTTTTTGITTLFTHFSFVWSENTLEKKWTVFIHYLFIAFENGAFKIICTAISCNITKYFEIAAIMWNIENPINRMTR